MFEWSIEKIKTFMFNQVLGWIWTGLATVGGSTYLMAWLVGVRWEWIGLSLLLLSAVIYFVQKELRKRELIKCDILKRSEVDTVIYMTSLKCLEQAIKELEKNEVARLHDNAREIISHNFLRGLTYNLSFPDDFVNRLKSFLDLTVIYENELRSTSSIKWEIKLSSAGECIEERDLYCLVEDLKKDVQILEKHFAEKIKSVF